MENVPVSLEIYGKEMVGRTQSLIERKFVALSLAFTDLLAKLRMTRTMHITSTSLSP